ncbi:MAG TPA: methyltransferase domain-containing protein [Candidatus Binataceae bacterium]|nr:methyltransferase domain-containing protein [Candidatus Binataceae bacterium]
MGAWYQDDSFWETWARYLFAARLENTPYEVERITQLLQLNPGEHALDVCCGMGRHLLELCRRGYRVTGVDRTAAYLAKARAQAESEGLGIQLIQEDVRKLDLPPIFDGALNMYTSFGYFDEYADDLQLAINIRKSLRPGRKFLIQTEGKEVMARNYRDREWFWHDDGSIGLLQRAIRDGWEQIETRWILLRNGRIEWDSTISSRIYSAAEMRALLEAAGFIDVKIFGSLGGVPYDHAATVLIAVATA